LLRNLAYAGQMGAAGLQRSPKIWPQIPAPAAAPRSQNVRRSAYVANAIPVPTMGDAPVTGARSRPYMVPSRQRSPGGPCGSLASARRQCGPSRGRAAGEGSASGISVRRRQLAVRSLGPPTTMSFRLAIGH
jgi:hypothetical protein